VNSHSLLTFEYEHGNIESEAWENFCVNTSVLLLPIELAQEKLRVNTDFDEGVLDGSGHAVPDAEDPDLNADRDSYHDTNIKQNDVVKIKGHTYRENKGKIKGHTYNFSLFQILNQIYSI